MTAIKKCYCEHAYQDAKYGKGMRVCNKRVNGYRCTVCGKDITDLATPGKRK